MSKVSEARNNLVYSRICRQFYRIRAKGAVGGPGYDRRWNWNKGEGVGLQNALALRAVLKSSDGLRWSLIGWVWYRWLAQTHSLFPILCFSLSFIHTNCLMCLTHMKHTEVLQKLHALGTCTPIGCTYNTPTGLTDAFWTYKLIQVHNLCTHREDMYPKQLRHQPCSQTCMYTWGHTWKHANIHACIGHAYAGILGQATHTQGAKHTDTWRKHTLIAHLYIQNSDHT